MLSAALPGRWGPWTTGKMGPPLQHHTWISGHLQLCNPFSGPDSTTCLQLLHFSQPNTYLCSYDHNKLTHDRIIPCKLFAAASDNFILKFSGLSSEVCSEALHFTDTRINKPVSCSTTPPYLLYPYISYPNLKGFSDVLSREPGNVFATSSSIL